MYYLFQYNQVLGPMRVQLLHPVSRFKRVQSLQHLCRYINTNTYKVFSYCTLCVISFNFFHILLYFFFVLSKDLNPYPEGQKGADPESRCLTLSAVMISFTRAGEPEPGVLAP